MDRLLFKRTLAVILTVTLCVSMLQITAFAASFDDLQNAIEGNTEAGDYIGTNSDDHYGYGKNDDGSYGVESWTETKEDGSSDRNVQLNEDVSKEDGKEDGVVVEKEDGDVTLDLNGNDITSDNYDPEVGTAPNGTPGEGGEYGSVIEVKDDASLTIKDTSSDRAEEQGTISGGFGVYDGGGGILVNGGTLNMEGGNVSDNASFSEAGGVGVVNGGEFNMSGGNVSGNVGGGVSVKNDSEFNMSGGSVSDNDSRYNGGGVSVKDNSEFNMSGGTISDNDAKNQGGGVYIEKGGSFTMDGGTISGNTSGQTGGGVTVNDHDLWNKSDFTMNGGTISGNTSGTGGGVYAPGKSQVTVNGGDISVNTAKGTGGGVDASNLTMNGGAVSGNTSGKGGGGINVGNLTLNGGTIEGNTALNGEGGGIHINGTAEITGSAGNVYIRNNKTTTEKDLGGGGIYVSTNAKLTLTNVVVYGNTAGVNGGGLAACQTGRTFVYATDGGAFFDNHGLGGQDFSEWTDEEWNDFFDKLVEQRLNTNCDGGSEWKNAESKWTVEQKKLFVTAAQDIFTASLGGYGSYDAGAIVGNVMLGHDQRPDNAAELTPEQIEEVAKHLANWTGYSVRFDKPNDLNSVGDGNNGTVFGDRFLVLTAHPAEEAKQAAMNAGKVFISGNESVNTHGGGIANNGVLIIGKETQGISSVNTGLNKDWVDADGNELELIGGDFSFTMTGGLEGGETKTVTVKNDKEGNASFNFFGDGLFTKPGTYVFYLSEVEDEELAKQGLTYDKSQYKVTIVIKEESIQDSINNQGFNVSNLVLEDMRIEQVMDAQGNTLDEPMAVENIQFVNTGKPAKPEEPKPEEPKPEEPKPEEPKPEEPKPEEPKPEEPKPEEPEPTDPEPTAPEPTEPEPTEPTPEPTPNPVRPTTRDDDDEPDEPYTPALIEIDEPDVPMAYSPRTSTAAPAPTAPADGLIEILDEEVPLAGLPGEPGTGVVSHNTLWTTIFAASLAGLLLLSRKDEEDAA